MADGIIALLPILDITGKAPNGTTGAPVYEFEHVRVVAGRDPRHPEAIHSRDRAPEKRIVERDVRILYRGRPIVGGWPRGL